MIYNLLKKKINKSYQRLNHSFLTKKTEPKKQKLKRPNCPLMTLHYEKLRVFLPFSVTVI